MHVCNLPIATSEVPKFLHTPLALQCAWGTFLSTKKQFEQLSRKEHPSPKGMLLRSKLDS